MTMQAARPDEALWRVATRAKISINHGRLDPNATKRDAKGADSRRLLTIMASRLMRDTLTIAENAAQGLFPSMDPSSVKSFDFVELQQRIQKNNAWDIARNDPDSLGYLLDRDIINDKEDLL